MKNSFKLNAIVLMVLQCGLLTSEISKADYIDIYLGTYTGYVVTGQANIKMPCTVTVTKVAEDKLEIQLTSPRLESPMVWKNFDLYGGDLQLNNSIAGRIRIWKNEDRNRISEVMMQYKTIPGGPFNLSTVSEFCVDLKRH